MRPPRSHSFLASEEPGNKAMHDFSCRRGPLQGLALPAMHGPHIVLRKSDIDPAENDG